MQTAQTIICELFEQQLNSTIITVEVLPASASPRKYFRLIDEQQKTYIGVKGTDELENRTFITLANWFEDKGLNVPKILAVSTCKTYYIQEDLGTDGLYDFVKKEWLTHNDKTFPETLKAKYKQVLTELINWQTKGTSDFDFKQCQPVSEFNEQAIQWDFNYFKYYFAKLCGTNLNETALQQDFDKLLGFLMQADMQYFMHRDFQSRNIIVL